MHPFLLSGFWYIPPNDVGVFLFLQKNRFGWLKLQTVFWVWAVAQITVHLVLSWFTGQPEIWAEFTHRIVRRLLCLYLYWGYPSLPASFPVAVIALNSVLWFFEPVKQWVFCRFCCLCLVRTGACPQAETHEKQESHLDSFLYLRVSSPPESLLGCSGISGLLCCVVLMLSKVYSYCLQTIQKLGIFFFLCKRILLDCLLLNICKCFLSWRRVTLHSALEEQWHFCFSTGQNGGLQLLFHFPWELNVLFWPFGFFHEYNLFWIPNEQVWCVSCRN